MCQKLDARTRIRICGSSSRLPTLQRDERQAAKLVRCSPALSSQATNMISAMVRMRLILSGSKTRLEKTLKKRGATTSAASQPASMTCFSHASSFDLCVHEFSRSTVSTWRECVETLAIVSHGHLSYRSACIGSKQTWRSEASRYDRPVDAGLPRDPVAADS